MKKILELDVKDIIPADWNYKKKATPEQLEQLAKSIKADDSLGILAVREVKVKGKLKYECFDGNHRLEAAIEVLKWDKIQCENFGPIKKPEAIVISRKRNKEWFETDDSILAQLMKDEVLPNMDSEDLIEIGLDTEESIASYMEDWNVPVEGQPVSRAGENKFMISLEVKENVHQLWIEFLLKYGEIMETDNKQDAMEFLLVVGNGLPKNKFKKLE